MDATTLELNYSYVHLSVSAFVGIALICAFVLGKAQIVTEHKFTQSFAALEKIPDEKTPLLAPQ